MERKPRDPFAELFGEDGGQLASDRWRPAVDVLETEKNVIVRVALAGVHRGELRVAVEGDTLCIRGQRSQPAQEEILRHHQLEIELGPFERRVALPAAIEREQVSARLEEGVLHVVLPKRAPRRIEVVREGEES